MLKVVVHLGVIGILSVLGCCQAAAQVKPVPMDELTDSIRLHPKPALILIVTDWCVYCRMQKAQLRKNRHFQSSASRFYFVEFNAETEEDITFNNRTYTFKSTGVDTGLHELAYALGQVDNKLAFPTWVVINEKFEIIFNYGGVLNPENLNNLLNSFAHL